MMFSRHHTSAVNSHGTVYQVPPQATVQAPEIDPASAMGPILVLAMCIAIVLGRRTPS